MKKRYIALFMALVLSLGILAGCGDKTDKPKEDAPVENNEDADGEKDDETSGELADEQKFVFSDNSAVLGLNPLLNTTGPDNGAQGYILESLTVTVPDEDGGQVIEPGQAEDWKISDDGLVYTFKIREDAKWNDGVDVTAHDFEYTFRTMATPETGSTNAWLFDGVIENFAEALYDEGKKPEDIGVKALDDKTLEITLEKPFAAFLDLINGAKPVREDKFEEWGEAYGSSVDKVLMNGPFIATSWDQDVQMTFEKNEDYWGADEVKLEKIERKVIKEPATAIQALIGGEIDVVGTGDPDWQEVIEAEGDRFRLITTPGKAPEFLGLNCQNEYLKNPKIRMALSIAYDREKYIEDINYGKGEPLYSMMPAVIGVGDELYKDVVNNENQIVKALQEKYPDPKELLIEGLEEEGFDPDPAKMEISYATRGTTEYSKKSSEWLLQEWQEKLGLTITIDMMDWNIMWDKVDQGDYDICTAGWGPYYNDPMALLELYEPENGYFNSEKSGWTGPDAEKYTELLDKASNTVDDKERAELLLEAEKLLVGTGVIIPTYAGVSSTYLASYVQNYHTSPHTTVDFRKVYISAE